MISSEDLFAELDTHPNPIHDWYRFVLGYEANLVCDLLDAFAPGPGANVLDPFCGTGTTLVEGRKRGLPTVGLDANPVATFVTRAKLQWQVDATELLAAAERALKRAKACDATLAEAGDEHALRIASALPGFAAFEHFGLVERHWIAPRPLGKVLALREALFRLADGPVRHLLTTALLSVAVRTASNLKFGPEAYCALRRDDAPVLEAFERHARKMAADLEHTRQHYGQRPAKSRVVDGDARDAAAMRSCKPIDVVITSPPYPTEKDYTRNTRLEMILLACIADLHDLRTIKQTMIRSHSKGVYKNDRDGDRIAANARIGSIVDELREKCRDKTYGFAKVYPRVVSEYFGGMQRHFEALHQTARSGCRAAYVVGQQRTYLQTHIPTAECLAELAEHVGFTVTGIETYRVRRGTTGSKRDLPEEVLLLRK